MKTIFTKRVCLLLLMIGIGISAAKAQSADTVKRNSWRNHDWNKNVSGATEIQVEYRKSHVGKLNTYLVEQGFPALDDNNIWYNLGMSRIYNNRFITTLGIGGTGSKSVVANDVKVSMFSGQIQVGAGYNVATSTNYRLYPTIGLNFQNSFLKVKDLGNINSTTDFGEELTKSSSSKTLNQYTFGLEFGGGFDYVIKLKSKQMDCVTLERNIPIGIRAGYYLPVSNSDWRVDDHKLVNGPDVKTGSFFVTVVLGLGYGFHK